MEIFTSLTLSSHLAPHETDRQRGETESEWVSERERHRGRDALHGCVWQIVFAWGSMWCLYNVWVWLFVYVYSVRAWVGVCFLNSAALSGWGAEGAECANREVVSGPWAYCRGSQGATEQRRGQSRSAVLCVAGPCGPLCVVEGFRCVSTSCFSGL